jgi:uncharacterized protein
MLSAGNDLLHISRTVHLTGLWDTAQTALGRPQDTEKPPLLAAESGTPLPLIIPTLQPSGSHESKRAVHPQRHTVPVHAHAAVVSAPLRRPTHQRPLKLLITGDSLPGFLGPQVLNGLVPSGRVRGWTEVHDGTGLTRPDYVDWSVVARQEVRTYTPDATIVLLGGNDFQNMVMPNGRVLIAGTPAWTQEYARRAAVCMRIWAQGNASHRVYWLSLPPARDASWAHDFSQINAAISQAATWVPGTRYVNILSPITDHGKYVDYARVGGQWTLIREPDGVHLNMAGSQVVANELIPRLRRDWHL